MNEESDSKRGERNVKRTPAEWKQALKKLVMREKSVRIIIPLILFCILASVAVAQLAAQQRVASYGTIKVIGTNLYWDRACSNKATSVPWGTIAPGTSATKYVYIRNEGTAKETLSMSYGNWTPVAAASYLTFTWNCSNYAISANAVVCAKLTLAVGSNITGITSFSFTITVQGSG